VSTFYITPLGRRIVPAAPRPLKRVLDFVLALLAVIVLSPLLSLIALLVKLTSEGPVFYRDDRLGLGGRPYKMLKFRSMKVGAPPVLTGDGKLVVARDDPRLTPIGKVLRMGFDELPQLFNVLRGEMSFVGPRSGRPQYESGYSDLTYERLRVSPGITGLASVLGGRHLSNHTVALLNARYARRQSLLLDAMIIALTLVYVLTGPRVPKAVLRSYIQGIKLERLSGDSAES